jgi:hypothetical protein
MQNQTLKQPYPRVTGCPLDAFYGAAGLLRREWGDYGYRIGFEGQRGTPDRPYLFACFHADGSYFYIAADRYGNATEVEWNGTQWAERGTL